MNMYEYLLNKIVKERIEVAAPKLIEKIDTEIKQLCELLPNSPAPKEIIRRINNFIDIKEHIQRGRYEEIYIYDLEDFGLLDLI